MADLAQVSNALQPMPWWHRVTKGMSQRRRRRETALRLYGAIVDEARQPALFTALQVPDSREGRLEALLLHAGLVLRRLQREGDEGQALAQSLFDLMFDDIDQHMREWGVGDLSVGKHVKRVAQTFYARLAALEPGLRTGDADAMVEPLARNVHGAADAVEPARRLAVHLLAYQDWLATVPGATLLAGELARRA